MKSDNELSGIYCQMASELCKLNKDSFELQKLDFKHRLLMLSKAGVEKTSIISAEHLCPFFPKYHNKIYSVKDELKNQSFPKRICTRIVEKYDDGSKEILYEMCHCLYLAYFEE